MTTQNILLLILSALMLTVMIPLVPKMILVRVHVLRWLHLKSLANWHERHIKVLTTIIRLIIAAIAIILILIVFL